MSIVVEGIQPDSLSPEEKNALAVLVHLPLDDFDALKQRMRLGVPGVVGPQTLRAFGRLCLSLRIDLSPDGVNAFKAAHGLGNAGPMHGVIGPETARAYYADILQRMTPATVDGIDVSDFQGSVDWGAVAGAGTAFAYAKATEGTGFTASTFASNWSGMKAAGLLRGAYHFFRPTADAAAQARHFLAVVTHQSGDLPPALDVEVGPVDDVVGFLGAVQTWLAAVEQAVRVKPFIYTYPAFWEGPLGNSTRLAEYPLWIAQYGPGPPVVPGGFSSWRIHQYASDGRVPDVAGNVDMDRFHGGLDRLEAMRIP